MKSGGEVTEWKGRFGFVSIPGARVFLHKSEVESNRVPREGDLVEFEVVETEDGLQAREARIIRN